MKINGKDYKLPEFTFETMCELENYGMSLTSINEKPLSAIRAFAALAIGDKQKANIELEEHFKNGGDITEITEEIQKSLSESGFFRSLSARMEERSTTSEEA